MNMCSWRIHTSKPNKSSSKQLSKFQHIPAVLFKYENLAVGYGHASPSVNSRLSTSGGERQMFFQCPQMAGPKTNSEQLETIMWVTLLGLSFIINDAKRGIYVTRSKPPVGILFLRGVGCRCLSYLQPREISLAKVPLLTQSHLRYGINKEALLQSWPLFGFFGMIFPGKRLHTLH